MGILELGAHVVLVAVRIDSTRSRRATTSAIRHAAQGPISTLGLIVRQLYGLSPPKRNYLIFLYIHSDGSGVES